MNTRKIKNAPIQDELDNPSAEDELKKQYHPAFCAAMELELREDKDHLIFEDEYNLNTKPNKIDFLVINVSDNVRVKSRLRSPYVWINKITSRLKPEDILQMQKEIAGLSDEIDLVNAESVVDMSISLNKDKEYLKEMMGMGALRDMFKEEFEERDRKISDLSEQLESKDKQLQTKDKQLQTKDEQLQTEHEENVKLRKEIEELKKLVGNKIAML